MSLLPIYNFQDASSRGLVLLQVSLTPDYETGIVAEQSLLKCPLHQQGQLYQWFDTNYF